MEWIAIAAILLFVILYSMWESSGKKKIERNKQEEKAIRLQHGLIKKSMNNKDAE